MTAKSGVQYVVEAHLFSAPPAIGAYFASPSGVTVLLVTRLARVIGAKTEQFRLYVLRMRRSVLPADTVILPWPRERRPVGRPSLAATPSSPSDKPAIVTRQQKQAAERKAITGRRRELVSDPANALVDPIRRQNGTALSSKWRDPADVDVRRRSPKVISGFRASDCLDTLQQSGTLSRAQVGAAKRLRRDWEVGVLMTNGSVDWEKAPTSHGAVPVGMSERVMQFLERYTRARAAMGRLYEIVDFICLQEKTLKDYAARNQINPSSASGRLYAALQSLQDWYDTLDEPEKQRATIGSQTGPAQLEPSAPPAARKWAAD